MRLSFVLLLGVVYIGVATITYHVVRRITASKHLKSENSAQTSRNSESDSTAVASTEAITASAAPVNEASLTARQDRFGSVESDVIIAEGVPADNEGQQFSTDDPVLVELTASMQLKKDE